MAKLNSIKQDTNNKFLNLYTANFTNEETGKDFNYFIASRRKKDELACVTKNHKKCDAVVMFCRTADNSGVYLIRQFRPAINDYVLESPAGLIDQGETADQAAKREVYEETGLTVESVHTLTPVCYTSEGMTDESITIKEVIVSGTPNLENKEENEDIEVLFFNNQEIFDVLDGKYGIISVKTYLMLQMYLLSINV